MILFTNTRKSCTAASAVLLSLVLSAGPAAGEIIPPDRTAPWQGNVGVPGGIPNRTTIWKNIVTDLGADPTGVRDCSPIIQSALDSCPAGLVVYIPEGQFRVETVLHLGNSEGNRTLRGAGMARTILVSANNAVIFSAGDEPWPPRDQNPANWIPITSGATKGSNTVTVSDTSRFAVGAPIAIAPNVMPVWAHNLGGFSDTLRNMMIYCKVNSKTATTVTFEPALPFDFSGMTPVALADTTPMIQGVGIEDLTCDMSNSKASWAVWYMHAWGCWVKNVEVNGAYTRQMLFSHFLRGEVRGCYTHDVQGAGPNHEGITFGSAAWNLVEDNICNNAGNPPIIFGDGASRSAANVIAYNYVVNSTPGFWDISVNHGPHSILCLIEGNLIKDYEDDGYFGSSSHNTLFRNSVSGQIRLKHFTNYYNIVGNVLGADSCRPGLTRTYEDERSNYWSFGVCPIYELGFPNIGNVSYVGTFGPTTPPNYSTLPNTLDGTQQFDGNVKATILRHGNFDYANNHTMWDPAIPDHTISNSLYLPGKPSWWGVLPWPPIGPDRSPMVGPIPAQQRFANGMPTYTLTPSTTACSQLQQRMDQLQRQQQRLKQRHRSNRKLNQRIRQLRRQLQVQHCS
jgi:pectate lyase-like protein